MKVVKLAAGMAIGYVLGSRAGREKYEQIVETVRKVNNQPGVVRAKEKATEAVGAKPAGSTPEPKAATPSEPKPAPTSEPKATSEPKTATTSEPKADAVPRPPRRKTAAATTTTTVVTPADASPLV